MKENTVYKSRNWKYYGREIVEIQSEIKQLRKFPIREFSMTDPIWWDTGERLKPIFRNGFYERDIMIENILVSLEPFSGIF